MNIVIDSESGFCFGVRRAIATLEEKLAEQQQLYCVGDIVHNEREIERLERKGLKVISAAQLCELRNTQVLFRAHGEPPSSYATVRTNNLTLTDATCPVVLKLQQRISEAWQRLQPIDGQIVLFGKKGHAEVIGLMGQTQNKCVLVENASQIDLVDPQKETEIFSQTTQDPGEYQALVRLIEERVQKKVTAHHTICKQMSDRADRLKAFAATHDAIIFVGGAKSSNSKVLFEICRSINSRSYFVTSENELQPEWFRPQPQSVGIFGATSTPLWLMQRIEQQLAALC